MSITFRQLEVFVAAARDCNFRRTADRLDISQPSVSNHIRALEDCLGHSLFDRQRGMPPALSAGGAAFLEKAQELVAGRADLASAIHLTVMAGPLLLDTCIRPRLPEFCAAHPRICLQFLPLHPSRTAADLLRAGEIDMAVFTGDCGDTRNLQVETIETVGCSIYAPPSLAPQAGCAGSALWNLPWVMPPEDFAPAGFLWRTLWEADVTPRTVVARSQFPDVAASLAMKGHGATVMFDDFASRGIASGQLVRLGPALPNTARMLLVGRRAQSSACAPAVQLLRAALREPLHPH